MQRLNTIRFRLTIWNSIVVIVLASLSLFLTRQAMVYTLEQETRELLKEEVSELALAINELHPDHERVSLEFSRKVLSHQRNQWFAWLIDGSGNTLWESSNVPIGLTETRPIPKSPFSFRQKENYLTCWHTFELKTGEPFTIVLGEPMDFIGRDLWNLTKVLLWIGLAVFFVAPIGGYLLARSSMFPVQEIVNTTRKLKPSILEERLPIRGNGDELDQISAEINSFLDSNQRFLKSQREFIANAAHELRSPLTAIQTSAEVCLSQPRSVEETHSLL